MQWAGVDGLVQSLSRKWRGRAEIALAGSECAQTEPGTTGGLEGEVAQLSPRPSAQQRGSVQPGTVLDDQRLENRGAKLVSSELP